jgi:hypothetical protein
MPFFFLNLFPPAAEFADRIGGDYVHDFFA